MCRQKRHDPFDRPPTASHPPPASMRLQLRRCGYQRCGSLKAQLTTLLTKTADDYLLDTCDKSQSRRHSQSDEARKRSRSRVWLHHSESDGYFCHCLLIPGNLAGLRPAARLKFCLAVDADVEAEDLGVVDILFRHRECEVKRQRNWPHCWDHDSKSKADCGSELRQ